MTSIAPVARRFDAIVFSVNHRADYTPDQDGYLSYQSRPHRNFAKSTEKKYMPVIAWSCVWRRWPFAPEAVFARDGTFNAEPHWHQRGRPHYRLPS